MNGPVPIGLRALSVPRSYMADAPRKPPALVKPSGKSTNVLPRRTFTLKSSITSKLWISASSMASRDRVALPSSSKWRTRAAEFTGEPSWNVIPGRSVNVHSV